MDSRIRTSIRVTHTPLAAKPKLCNPRHPEQTLLYRTVAEHFETWLELASADVFPRLAVRQWVLSVPKRLRYFLQRDGAALNTALRIFLRVIQGSLHQHCPGAARVDKAALRIGAVAFIHSFGSNLNTHVHLHVCVVDGVFEAVAGEGARGNDATAPPGVIFHPAQRLLSRCRCLHQVPRPPRAGAPAEVLRAPTVCYG